MAFDFAHHNTAFAMPDYLSDVESWQEHIPFAFAVVSMTAPRVLVELGTHKGDSYAAFCQAVTALKLPTRCYAVDTWQGDEHVGTYGDDVLAQVRKFHDGPYSGFSTLLRTTFDEAVKNFADGSIDLLHIDGLHTYEAVRHDFETWLPKVSERGVVLFHDTAVHDKSFGVWKFWSEVSGRYPSFEFPHGHGLGVLAVGRDAPQAVKDICAASEPEAKNIRGLYAALGARVRHFGRERYIPMLQAMVKNRDEALSEHMAVIHARQNEAREAWKEVEKKERQAKEAWKHAQTKEAAAQDMWQELQKVQAARQEIVDSFLAAQHKLEQIEKTLVWRGYTKLRRIIGRADGG